MRALAAALIILAAPACIDQTEIGELPEVRYAAPVNAYAGQRVVFDASSSYDPEGRIDWYQFDFGDGTPAVRTRNPVTDHAWAIAGQFTTKVGVIDEVGNKFTELREISIVDRGAVPFLLCHPNRPYCPPYFLCNPENHHCDADVDGDGVPQAEDQDEPSCATDAACPAMTVCRDALCVADLDSAAPREWARASSWSPHGWAWPMSRTRRSSPRRRIRS